MIGRCTRENHPDYQNYGARGIAICDRWLSFDNFLADMESTFVAGLQIDRIENDKGYFPENCRWTTVSTNIRNRRNTIFVDTPWGRLTTAEAAGRAGVSPDIFYMRHKRGWSTERLFPQLASSPENKTINRTAGDP